MQVVHSLRAADITSQSSGARLLRDYLQYSANPTDFFARQAESSQVLEAESPFEEAVIAALRERGYSIHPQVGVAGYRIDLGVLSEDRSHYLLGIECDGYTYHAAPAARDRDWLRQEVLEGLGWTMHRVWSTAWIRNPRTELALIEAAIEKARADRDDGSAPAMGSPLSFRTPAQKDQKRTTTSHPLVSESVVESESQSPSLEDRFEEYDCAILDNIPVDTSLDLQVAGIYTLRPLIERVVEIEMPIRADQVAERIRSHWGLRRTGQAIWDRIKTAIRAAVQEGAVAWDGNTTTGRIDRRFLVIPSVPIKPRRPKSDERPRPIDLVSAAEIAQGLLAVTKAIHGGKRNEIIVQTAREFGYRRTGGNIEERIGAVLHRLVQQGKLRELQGILVAVD